MLYYVYCSAYCILYCAMCVYCISTKVVHGSGDRLHCTTYYMCVCILHYMLCALYSLRCNTTVCYAMIYTVHDVC